jgi:hypothetical protein
MYVSSLPVKMGMKEMEEGTIQATAIISTATRTNTVQPIIQFRPVQYIVYLF